MTTREVTAMRLRRHHELLRRGYTTVEIADDLRISLRNLNRMLARARQESKAKQNLTRVGELTDQGLPPRVIANTLGISARHTYRLQAMRDSRQVPACLPDVRNQPWTERAECAKYEPELWFAASAGPVAETARARAICRQCPVIDQCRTYVMVLEGGQTASSRFGIWAAMDGRERWLLSRRQKRAAS